MKKYRTYARLGGKLACWILDATSVDDARKQVRDHLGLKHRGPILVCL